MSNPHVQFLKNRRKYLSVDKSPLLVAISVWAHNKVVMPIREHSKIVSRKPLDPDLLDKASLSIGIADAMNECLWFGDENHRTLYVNPVYEKTSGYSLKECIGQPADFCFDEESKKIIARHHKLRNRGVPSQYEATMVSKSGKKIPVLVSGAPTKTGGTIGIFINLTNIKKLIKQETLTRKILQHTDKAFVILDKDRKITLWNSGAKILFGYKESEVLDKCIDVIIPPNERKNNEYLIEEVEKKGHVLNVETKRLRKSGTKIDVSASVTKVVDEDKNFVGYLLSYQDITQQKRDGDELQKRFEAIQDAYKELGLQKRHLDYFCEISEAATSTESLESLERLIVSAMSMLTKCEGVVLRSYDGARSLKLKHCFGVNKNWWNKGQIKYKNSIAEEAFKKRRSLIIDNIDAHTKHQGTQLLKDHRFKVLILLPLYINDKLLGTISLYATNPAKFRFIETTFLENMAKLCSLAIHSKTTQNI